MSTTIVTTDRAANATSQVAFARATFARVESVVIAGEAKFGRAQLLQTFSSMSPEQHREHVVYYRGIIRSNWWPHVETGWNETRFLAGFEDSAVAYASTAMGSLHTISANAADLTPAHRNALAAESLRGQYGKSSPDGLDVRLDALQKRLLDGLGGDEQALIDLGSLSGELMPAESAVLHDFIAVRKHFPTAPTISDIMLASPESQEVIWNFLRRHHRWNVASLAHTYEALADASDKVRSMDERRNELVTRRLRLLTNISPHTAELVDEVVALNFLNLVLEPAYGFKGGVGLILGSLFRQVERAIPGRTPIERQALLEKQCLLRTHQGGES